MSDVREQDRKHTIRGARTNFFTLLGQASFFLFGAVAARMFGKEIWGAYTTAYLLIDVLVRTSLLGGDKAVLVFVAARRAQQDEPGAVRAVASSLRLVLLIAAVFAIGMAVASYPVAHFWGEPLQGEAMRYLSPVVVLSGVTMLLLATTMSAKVLRYNFIAKGVTEPVTMLVLAALFGVAMPTMVGLALAPLAASAIALAVAAYGVSRLFSLRDILGSVRRDPTEREVVKFTLPLALAEFLNILAMRLGGLILIAYVAVGERGIFNTCLLLAGTISFLRGMFDTVLGPVAAEAWAQNDHPRLAANLKSQTRMVLLLVLPFASLFIVGGAAILSAYGPGFAEGHRTMVWLAVGHIANASLGLTAWLLMAAQRTRAILVNNVAKLALEIVLLVILIPPLGIEGAGIATMVAIVTLHGLQVYEVWRLAGIHPFSWGMARLAILGTVIIGAELVAYHLMSGSAPFRAIVVLGIGTPLYFLIAWQWREPRPVPRAA